MKKAIYFLLATPVIIAVFYFIVANLPGRACREVQGKVSAVYSSTRESIFLKMTGIKTGFQIVTTGDKFNTETLRNTLVGKDVRITYRERWTPLDPASKHQIATLSLGEELVYEESKPAWGY